MNKFLKFGFVGLLSAGLAVPAFAQGSATGEAISRATGGYNGGGPYSENSFGPGGQYERQGNYEPGYQAQGRRFQNEEYGAQNDYGPPRRFNRYNYNGGEFGNQQYGPENRRGYSEGNQYGRDYGQNGNFNRSRDYGHEGYGMNEPYNGPRGDNGWEGGYGQR